jgi:hypothetical protein
LLRSIRPKRARRGRAIPSVTASAYHDKPSYWPLADTLAVRRRALEGGHLDLADFLLQQVIDLDPSSLEALTLHGALHEALGEHHAAYQSYRTTLIHDPNQSPALDALLRAVRPRPAQQSDQSRCGVITGGRPDQRLAGSVRSWR